MSDSEEKDISPEIKQDSEAEDEKTNGEEMDTNEKDEETEESPSKKSEDTEDVHSPKKSNKNKVEQKEDDEEDEESDEEPRLGLLEKPVVIESGKREKKKVERLSMQETALGVKKKVEIAEGSGEKLGDMPRVEHLLQKTKTEKLRTLHKLLFGLNGRLTEIKRNIRQFNGFAFQKDDKEYEKKSTNLSKNTMAVLKFICEILDVEKKGTKEEITDRLMTFCLNPKSSGKNVPAPKKKKRKSGVTKQGTKRKRKETKTKSETKVKKAKQADDSDQEDEDDDKSDADDESEEQSKEEESDSEEEEAPKKKKAKTESPKKVKKTADKKKPAKKETTKKGKSQKKKESSESEVSDDDSDDDSDEEPLNQIKKKPPTNDELKTVIKKILDKANLEELTMKSVIKQVHGKFPAFDLTDRKDFIKKTVRSLIT